jgi:hypothetical protein
MTQPAFFEHGLIKDIGTNMPEYPASMVAQVPDNAKVGWTWDGTTAVAPQLPIMAPETIFAPRDFMRLFTSAEQTALFTARRTTVQVDQFITLAMAGNVDLTNAEVVADINALVPMNLLTVERAAAILAGRPAP